LIKASSSSQAASKGGGGEWVGGFEWISKIQIFVCMLGSGVRLLAGCTRDKATVRKADQNEDMHSNFKEKTLNTHAFNNGVV